MLFTLLTAGIIGMSFARLTILVFDMAEDESPGVIEHRLTLTDQIMCAMPKPGVVIAPDDAASGGVFAPAKWPAASLPYWFGPMCGSALYSPCYDGEMSKDALSKLIDLGPETPTKDDAREAVSRDAECYICFDRDADSVFLPCGHSGTCYRCAIENTARCETCPCCRKVVEQVVTYDGSKPTKTEGGRITFPVTGPRKQTKFHAPPVCATSLAQ